MKRSVQLFVLVVIIAVVAWVYRDRVFIRVDSGNVLVVYHLLWGGASGETVGGEGLHIILPWDAPNIYSIREQTLLLPLVVLSKDGLAIKVDAEIRFRAVRSAIPNLHRRYGPDYVKSIIIPQLTESVMEIIGSSMATEMYSLQHTAQTDRFWNHAKRTIGGIYVSVTDIALFNIRLPEAVERAVQSKAEAQQQAQAAAFLVQREIQEAERKGKEAQAEALYMDVLQNKVINKSVLVWRGIEATLELAKSPNAKIIVMGSHDNLPLMLGNVPDLVTK